MKVIVSFISSVLIIFTIQAQKAKLKYHDSVWYELQKDTVPGKISFLIGNGEVSGDGILVTVRIFECSQRLPIGKPKLTVEGRDTLSWFANGGIWKFSKATAQTYAYIKTFNGYKMVIQKFTFKPF